MMDDGLTKWDVRAVISILLAIVVGLLLAAASIIKFALAHKAVAVIIAIWLTAAIVRLTWLVYTDARRRS
jgi:hypothetical protein